MYQYMNINYNTVSPNKLHLYIQSTVLCTNIYINYNTVSPNKLHLYIQSTVPNSTISSSVCQVVN